MSATSYKSCDRALYRKEILCFVNREAPFLHIRNVFLSSLSHEEHLLGWTLSISKRPRFATEIDANATENINERPYQT